MRVSMIAAMDRNGVIGANNKLVWHIPEDLRHFKRLTLGKPVIMGRKTFDSIGRPLPQRTNIVITRRSAWQAEGVNAVCNLEEALDLADKTASRLGETEVFIIGGEQIYRLALSFATRMYITEIDAEVDGDAFFPEFDREQWPCINSGLWVREGNWVYRFLVLEKSGE